MGALRLVALRKGDGIEKEPRNGEREKMCARIQAHVHPARTAPAAGESPQLTHSLLRKELP